MTKFLSACGIDCTQCECRLATQADDDAQRAEVAAKWATVHNPDITAKDINCDGCMTDGVHFAWCSDCPIRACVSAKGYDSCASCDQFPCQTNEFLYNAAPSAKENILSLR